MDATHSFNLGNGWSADAYGSLGLTRLGAMNSVFTGGQMMSSRFGLSFSGPVSNSERVSLGFAQPLMVESGSLKMNLGTGYDLATRSLIMQSRSASVGGGQRPFMLTGGYSKAWSDEKSFRLGVSYDAMLKNASALMSFRTGF